MLRDIDDGAEISDHPSAATFTESSTSMPQRYSQPANEDAFEEFCLVMLRQYWATETLERYGHRGERQDGIDLYDTAGTSPIRAVQCKHHKANNTLPPRELEAEVNKARNFALGLDEYYLLTTAKKSAATQKKVQQLNAQHLASGHFKVRLFFWDDIERIIEDLPAAQDALNMPTPRAMRALLREQLQPLRDDISRYGSSACDSELDEIKSLLGSGQSPAAAVLLDRLRSRSWDQLSMRNRFRWSTQRADAYLKSGNSKEAARLLLQAKTFQPEEEIAIANEVYAYLLLDEVDKARRTAEEACKAAPHSALLYSALIGTAQSDDAAVAYFKQRPTPIAEHPSVWEAAARRTDTIAPSEAEPLIRRALEVADDRPSVWFALSCLLLRVELGKADPGTSVPRSRVDVTRLEEAKQCCSKALELASGGNPEFITSVHLQRAVIHSTLGDAMAAEADIQAARRLAPSDRAVLLACARLEGERGRPELALEALRQLWMRNGDAEAGFFLAVALWNRDESGDRDEAVRLLKGLPVEDIVHLEESAEILIDGLLAQKCVNDARAWLLKATSLEPCLMATMLARIELSAGDGADFEVQVSKALEHVNEATPKATRRKLVQLLIQAGRLPDAIAVLSPLVVRGESNEDVHEFVSLAGRLGRDKDVLEVCSAARANGTMDPILIRWEAGLLDRYDPDAALAVLTQFLPHAHRPEQIRLHIASLALRIGKPELAEQQLGQLPRVADATATEGSAVVSILESLGKHNEAIEYSYDLLRRHFSEPDAHRAFRNAVLSVRNKDPLHTPQRVAPGCAVRVEEPDSASRWYVIEDSPVPADHVDDEIAHDSQLAQLMMGKGIGEDFVLSEGPGVRRAVKVLEIQPKLVRRLQDVLDRWQYRFPDLQEMWMMRVGDTGSNDADFAPLLAMLEAQRDNVTEVEEHYETNLVPIHLFASLIHKDELHALAHLAYSPKLPVRCCLGSQAEYLEAIAHLKAASQVVLDITALTTLLMVRRLNVLRLLDKRILVSHTTLAMVRKFASEAKHREHSPGSLRATENGHVLHVPSEADKANATQEAVSFLAELESLCTAVGCPALAAVPLEERQTFEQGIGESVLESSLIGAQGGTIAWSDDGVAHHLARQRFGTRRIWTQAVFRWLNGEGLLSETEYVDASVHLLAFNYHFTSVNSRIMAEAGRRVNWDPSGLTLRGAIRYLAQDNIDSGTAASLAAQLTADGFREMRLVAGRQNFLIAIAESLGVRKTASETLRQFRQALNHAFGLDIIGLRDAITTFDAWRKEFERRLRLAR